jgi:hypothetical protein
VLSAIPTDPRVSVGSLDKVGHLCEYWLFAWILVQVVRASPHTNRGDAGGIPTIGAGASRMREREYVLWAWLYATSYGGLMELLQVALPWRGADWTDALMNALGAALGAWLGTRWPAPQQEPA